MLVKSGMVPAGTPQARYAGSRSGPFRGTRYAVHREMRGARSASVVVSAVRGTRYTALPAGTLGLAMWACLHRFGAWILRLWAWIPRLCVWILDFGPGIARL